MLQPRLSGLAGNLERFSGLSRSGLVADCRTEIRQDGECSDLERVIAKTPCELERGAGLVVGLDEPLAEANRRGEPDLDVRLQHGARLGFQKSLLEQCDRAVDRLELGQNDERFCAQRP